MTQSPGVAHSPLGEMPTDTFLRDYWQKRPCLLKQALADYQPPLDENDIAGLACEKLAESRLITCDIENSRWQVRYGPFRERDLQALPASNWCLLVQDVEKHYPPLQSLLGRFDFLPTWRLDDLMVSVSAPGGSVGPHADQYDVFLFQASGQRRWQIAQQFSPGLLKDTELKVLESFEPEQEWVLQAGDVLYLPPGVAHFGVALDMGMTWSIGLRAPSQADLLESLGDWLTDQHEEGVRYTDPALSSQPNPGEIDSNALSRLISMLDVSRAAGSDAGLRYGLESFLASFISRYRLAHQPAPPDQQMTCEDLKSHLESGARLQRNPWTRLNWIATHDNVASDSARLFACGECFELSQAVAIALCGTAIGQLTWNDLKDHADKVTGLINQGHLWLEQPAG